MVSKLPIAKEGWPFIAIPGAIALGLALLGHRRLALPFAAAAAASAGFFRDPERAIPLVANGVLSPPDVHVNRAPIGGVVTDVIYTPGAFKPAYDKDADANERCAVRLQGEHA